MQKRVNNIISNLTIWTCTISYILCSAFLNIQPNWLNIVISFIISLITSYGVIYFLIGGIVRIVYKKRAGEFYLKGTWFIVYYSNYKVDHYLRLGKLVMLQDYEQIAIKELSSHTPEIQDGQVLQNKFRDHEESESPSTGHGFAKIDRQNRTLVGIYFVTRSSQQTAVGMFHCRINNQNGELQGEFTTTEPSRPNKKPVGGKLMLFRDENSQLQFCNKIIKADKEE